MQGQEVFRFVFLSPPGKKSSSVPLPFRLTRLSRSLLAIRDDDEARTRTFERVREFFESDDFSPDLADLTLYDSFQTFLKGIETEKQWSITFLEKQIKQNFGHSSKLLIKSQPFQANKEKLFDTIVALKILPDLHPHLLSEAVKLQRAIDLIERTAQKDKSLESQSPKAWLGATIALPKELFPIPPEQKTASDPSPTPDAGEREEEIKRLSSTIKALESATEALTAVSAEELTLVEPDSGQEEGEDDDSPPASEPEPDCASKKHRCSLDPADSLGQPINQDDVEPTFIALGSAAIARLAPETTAVLASLNIDPATTSLKLTLDRLEAEAGRLSRALNEIAIQPELPQFIRVGNTTLPANFPVIPIADDLVQPEAPGVPTSVGLVRPSGVGRLLLTRQQIKRYEAGEVAHIENILSGESRNRETRRLRRTEESITIEQETTKEEERDLQTTERMEMQREVQNTLKDSQQFKIGATISGGYGPFVQASVNTEFETESSSESTARTASNYAREVTEKTASRLTERIREEKTIRTIQEFEETNSHGFENTSGDNLAGIYQWVDKIYEAQVYDYGVRLFFNILVPEPAAFLLHVLETKAAPVEGLKKPDPIDFKPSDLTPSNYQTYIKKYQVTGVEPPPLIKKTISKVFRYPESPAGAGSDLPEEFTNSAELPIDDGYKATEAYVAVKNGRAQHGGGPLPSDVLTGVTVYLGQRILPFMWDQVPGNFIKGNMTASLSNEIETIPVAIYAKNLEAYIVLIEITCLRTSSYALARWQQQTYDAIVAQYLTLEAEYRERKAELELQDGVEIEGRNPAENRQIERTELKRLSVSMLTGQYFEAFNSILSGPFANIDFEEAIQEGRYARFFEQAFEWENMVYEFFPYYWGRRKTWSQKLLMQDVDPIHTEFLKSGYAEIKVPVRPDFEASIFHFLDTGTVWKGEELPAVTNPKYSAFMEEIRERRELEEPHQEIAVGEPWDIRLPTTLVRVADSAQLPAWQQDEETGAWVPVDNEA